MQKQRWKKIGKIFLKNALWAFSSVAFLLGVWAVCYWIIGNDSFLPSPLAAFGKIGGILVDGVFWNAFLGTLGRAIAAFFISFVLGVGLALIAYTVGWFRRFMRGVTAVVRSLPTLAITLCLLLVLLPSRAPIVVACTALFPMTYHSALNALDSVDGKLIEMCNVYRVPMKKRILGLYLPTAAPYVLKESAAAVSFSLKLTVSAEILALTPISLGSMMQQAQTFVEMPMVFALTLVAVAAACVLEISVSALAAAVERRVR